MTAASSAPGTFLPVQDSAHSDALIANNTIHLWYDSALGLQARVRINGALSNALPVSVTQAELEALHGVTATATELNYTDVTTTGTVEASKAVVVDANKDAGTFRNVVAVNFDAGASGVAGTVDVFPTTASKGKLAISVTDQTTNATVSLVAGAMAAARTITLADPLANADILTGKMAATTRAATSDGLTTGTIADSGILQFITVTSADANNIVVLPTPTPGTIVVLANGATGFELRTSAPNTIAINGGTGSAGESAIAASTLVIAVCKTATAWAALSLVGTTLAAVEAAAN